MGWALVLCCASSRERHSCTRRALFSYAPCPHTGCSPAGGVAGRAGSMVKGRQGQRPSKICDSPLSPLSQSLETASPKVSPTVCLGLSVISLHPSRVHSHEGQPVKPCLSSTVGTGAHTGTKLKEDPCVFNTLPTDHSSS